MKGVFYMAKNNFDVQINYIEDDLKKVQTKTNLYIQKYGDMGVFHLFKEVAQNAIDELSDPKYDAFMKSIGESTKKKIVKVTYDRLSDRVTVEDDGRGIPEEQYPLDIVCTKLNSGAKFNRDQGGVSSGEFGVGLTVVCALSSEFTMATYRNTYYHKIGFKDGEKILDENKELKDGAKKKHGLITSFISNPLYLGAGSRLPFDICIDWLEMMSYLVDDNIQFHITEYNGTELIRSLKVTKKPFSELINKFIPDESGIQFGPIAFQGKGELTEEIRQNNLSKSGKVKETTKIMTKGIKLEFAFAYDLNTTEFDYDAFCNFTKTDEGGVHVDAVDNVLCNYLQSKVMDSMTEAQRQSYPVSKNDIHTGLKLVVNLSTNAQVQFMGNAKNRIQNELIKPVLRDIAKSTIEKYFDENPSKLNDLCKLIKTNAKNRVELQKMRSATVKGKNTRFDDLDIANLIPANNSKFNEYRELFLIEGRKSAAGAMVDGRDSDRQAIFAFRGQTLNPFKTTFSKFMENEEWNAYVKTLRCGIGSTFDINKLYYQKIYISTDADIDGSGIATSIASTHVLYFPKIITAGKLYRCYPPLYRIDDKNHPFIGNKGELVEIYMKEVVKRYQVRIGNDYMTKDEFWQFLYDTVDYSFTLREQLQKFYKVPSDLIEIVAASLVINGAIDTRGNEPQLVPGILENQKFIRNFMQTVQKKFPEMTLDANDNISGIANGLRASFKLNNRFIDRIENLIPIYEKYGFIVGVKDKKSEERLMTILEFADATSSLTPTILTRFKGLGECNPDELWETVLNPANRIAVQLTMDSIERDLEIFRKLKSDKPSYAKQRAQMVASYKIKYEDIDN
jgi:DNA gyrase subunit B